MRRYLSAFAGSVALHAGVIALLVWSLTSGAPQFADDAKPPDTAITAFVVPGGRPGLSGEHLDMVDGHTVHARRAPVDFIVPCQPTL